MLRTVVKQKTHAGNKLARLGQALPILLVLLATLLLADDQPAMHEHSWFGTRGGPGMSGCVDNSALPETPRFAWRWPADLPVAHAKFFCAPAACLQDTLYVTINTGHLIGLAALATGDHSPESASSTKPPETNKWFAATTLPPGNTVAATTDRVYFTEGKMGDAERKLHCVEASNGRSLWQVPIAAEASGEFLLTADGIYLFCRGQELSYLTTTGADTGQTRWSKKLANATVGAPCVAGKYVLASTCNGVVAMKKATGEIIWQQPSAQTPVSGPVADQDMVVVCMSNGLSALSMVNGGTLWTVKCSPSPVPLVADAKRVLCTTTQGEIVMAGWDGRELLRLPGAMPNHPPMLFGDKLFFCGSDAMQLITLSADHTASRWLATAWLGVITSPPILSDGIVYFATAEKGVVCARQGKR